MRATKEDLILVDFIRTKVNDLEFNCRMLEREGKIRDFRLKDAFDLSKKIFDALVVLKNNAAQRGGTQDDN
jgi:hypothetical protein